MDKYTKKSKLNDIEFYDLMQAYRLEDVTNQEKTIERFEAVKKWITLNYVQR